MAEGPFETSAADRARWLAELGSALDEARRVMKRLGAAEGRIEAVELYARIEAVRLEVEAMQLAMPIAADEGSGPKRIKSPPWQGRGRDPR
ncbi:MAG TPA: hypothetical protein VIV07_08525 [Sphingomicrobium sp.]